MSQDNDLDTLYKTADKFIDMANEIAQTDTSGTVGAALRFAAARYSAYEMAMSGRDLAAEKESMKEDLLKDYGYMLDDNFQTYIRHLAMESVKK